MAADDLSADDSSYLSVDRRIPSLKANRGEMQQRNTSSGSSVTSNNTKTGRKGDPRMHRAVAARLANPKASLFEALEIGGFEYPNDDDATVLDSEHVTLGQRKNQLSRRIRLAIKNGNKVPIQSTRRQAGGEFGRNSMASQMRWPSGLSDSFYLSGNKRPRSRKEEHVLAHNPALAIDDARNMSPEQSVQPRIKATNHPEYHSLVVPRLPQASSKSGTLEIDHYVVHNRDYTTPTFIYPRQELDLGSCSNTIDAGQVGMQQARHEHVSSHDTLQAFATAAQAYGPSLSASAEATHHTTNEYAQHQTPSGVAILSLSQTASSVGMSLEQLALALKGSNSLAKVLISSSTVSPSQQELAVALYQSENRALYQRAMLMAGYTPEVAHNESSSHHLQVALTAWQLEGQRLQALLNGSSREDPPLEANPPSPKATGAGSSGRSDGAHNNRPKSSNRQVQRHRQDHHSQPDFRYQHVAAVPVDAGGGCAYESGRHIHRLEGKCGHMPILHQPVGGTPHIDFVIGNRVECYQGYQPLSQDLQWPSNYKCEDVGCRDTCRNATLPRKLKDHEHGAFECLFAGDPKILDLSDLNLDGDEWNMDVANGETLLGLFKLGDSQISSIGQELCEYNTTMGSSEAATAIGLALPYNTHPEML